MDSLTVPEERIRLSGIPSRYVGDARMDARCAAWADAAEAGVAAGRPYSGTFLLLAGGRGAGKTTTACSILQRCMRHRLGRFTTVSGMFRDMRAEFDGASPGDVLGRYRNTALLVVDDLGKEHLTDWSADQLFALVDGRWSNRMWTVFTTQYGIGDLHAKWERAVDAEYADALCSRLNDAENVMVMMKGGDRRG